ncbi:hypothetical protein V2S66_33735 [Streptomyces sp. V4-01]|uniref:Uncharacterized protein n=1 Tax=Actinacidiphila polyblastidii TaxID=3110430 RepID=A0ABU7PMK0_9ACTN|nr:hypothetical protein [Streptomyces sp. V4-01]
MVPGRIGRPLAEFELDVVQAAGQDEKQVERPGAAVGGQQGDVVVVARAAQQDLQGRATTRSAVRCGLLCGINRSLAALAAV